MRGLILFFVLVFSVASTKAQKSVVDSLKLALQKAAHDTTKCNILVKIVEIEYDPAVWPAFNAQLKTIAETNLSKLTPKDPLYSNFRKYLASAINGEGYLLSDQEKTGEALKKFEESIAIFESLNDEASTADILNNIGVIYFQQSKVSKALEYYLRALKIQEKSGNKSRTATACNNIASVYQFIGDIPKAIEYFSRALKLAEQSGNKDVCATALANISIIYERQGYYDKAQEYNFRALKLSEAIGDKNKMSYAYNNIGLIYKRQGKVKEALESYYKSIKLKQEIGNKHEIAVTYANIGGLYFSQGQIDTALSYYSRGFVILQELNDKRSITTFYNHIGECYLRKGNIAKALEYGLKGMQLSRETNNLENVQAAAELLTMIYKDKNDYKNAFDNYHLSVKLRDSISSEKTRKLSLQNQMQYEYEKKAAADSVKNAEEQKVKDAQLTAQRAQIKQEQFQRYGLFSGLVIVLVGLGFVINRFRVTQKQKKIIESQKVLVDHAYEKLTERNKEVLDSIHYAKRIQTALVTNENYIHKTLNRLKGV
ncbi:MAG: tetratricopeptide repeat protein [Bacteroidia bacterium]